MNPIDQLENHSIYLIREAYSRFRNIALLWSVGKDSTTLLWLCRKAFLGRFPFPVIHIDTGFKFNEIYKFRDEYAKKWDIPLIVEKNETALHEGMNHARGRLECCNALKTETLKKAVDRHHLKAMLLGIRRDEHGIRAKERFFSPRNKDLQWNYQTQPPELWNLYQSPLDNDRHFRIHPLLSWREIDVWHYIRREKIPSVDLYFAKNGRRYRSIGCETCCAPVASRAGSLLDVIKELETTKTSERSGRAQDKEDAYAMEKLRSLGYM